MIKIINVNKVIPLILFTSFYDINAQVKISNSSGVINTESVLHLESTSNNKGFLLTRITLQSTNLPAPLASHTAGMIVYNTATAGTSPNNVTPGLYYNNGTSWVKLSTKKPQIGDIKNGFQSADHNGWYLLNGRTVSTLAVNQRARAASLGFSAILPDATDRYLKNTSGSDNIGTPSGSDTFVLAQANLPNVTFTGTTDTTGSHTHTYTDNPTNSTTNGVAAGTNNPVSNAASVNDTTASSGAHTHSLSFTLGSSQAVSLKPDNIITNVFIYLGN
ncbi:hypothetical protein A0O34_13825 [Chryseobacterium glaciei]|uniref:Phage tail collar domain-containing protein n=1 Tax=Chryseobacterium glaciei TaxID=1685010 RepID=A0A172XX89_9FLAO|nr:hypothetical protein [Chryseobacterium glaciei]ANF51516.1 hypothetical protein A0O34_13825 [Chryseobacterium glaciei]